MTRAPWSLGTVVGLACALFLADLPIRAQRTVHATNRVAAVVDDRYTVSRPGNRHPLARAEYDDGIASPGMRMERMVLVLAPDADQQQALDELIASQQDPESPEYHQWLTPETFGSRFGVSEMDIDQIVHWLKMHGFDVEPISPARRSIVFSGPASAVSSAFHTEIHTYNVNGARHYANAATPEIPEAFAAVVQGVASLHNFPLHALHSAMHTAVEASRSPDRPAWTGSNGSHNLAPVDFATIYDLSPLYASSNDGAGQSIAVVGRTNIRLSDVESFRSMFGLPAKNPAIVLNGPDPGIVSHDEAGEALLDVEWSGAVAKQAAIELVVSASGASDGVLLSSQYIVNHNLAPVVSMSFGICEAAMGASENRFWNGLWQQAAAQGMTVLVASGDSGAAGCSDPSAASASARGVNGLCSSPYSTCVGGTEFSDATNPGVYWATGNSSAYGSALSYIPEAVWNQSAAAGGSGLWAGGGGPSAIYTKPSWQTGVGVPSDGRRDVPDVSLNASTHDAYLTCINGSFYGVGGTSAAAPAFAGLMALAVQKANARLGNVNPVLYTLATKQAGGGAAAFHDITAGNNSVPGLTGYSAGAGYDLGTGLGSVDAAQLINHWSDAAVSGPSFLLSASSTAVSMAPGSSAATTINLTFSGGFNSAIELSVSGGPAGLTATFSPATIPAGSISSTLTLNASSQAAAGVSNLTITASGSGITRTLPIAVTITLVCTYGVNPANPILAPTAASYAVQVTTASGCSWTAVSDSNWITVTSGGSGSGNGSVNYSVAANTTTIARSGVIAITGFPLTVMQAATAPFSLNPAMTSIGAAATTGSVAVSAVSPAASWTAVSNTGWITVTSGSSGSGNKIVTYSAAANTTTADRTGTMTIAGLPFTISQAGTACSYAVSPASPSLAPVAGSYTLQVSATVGCPWTAVSRSNWITVTRGASGSGNGIVDYSVAANTATTARSGAIAIAGLSLIVTQAPTAPFSLNPATASVGAAATTGSVAVSAAVPTAPWTAVSNTGWITVTSGASGTGSKVVSYSVSANTTSATRTGTMTIAGLPFTVIQAGAGCAYSLGTVKVTPNPAGFVLAFPVSATAGCLWTAMSNAPWLTIVNGATGAGNGMATYNATLNATGAPRTAMVVIAGIRMNVTQGK